MELDLRFIVPGDPVVKSRPRFTKYGKAYTPKHTVEAEAFIKGLALERVSEPYDGPVGVELTFYCATKRRTDGDNLLKLVMDALNGAAFVDDYLAEDVHYRLYRRAENEEPRTEVHIYSL